MAHSNRNNRNRINNNNNNIINIWATFGGLLLYWASFVDCQQNNYSAYQHALTYTRLRAHTYYLPILKNYQNKLPYEELEFKVNVSNNSQPQRFFVNPNVSSDAITRNELILEALDQAYMARLLQLYIADYDKPGQRELAMDPAKIDSHRCDRELNYLVSKLDQSQASQVSLNPELATFFDSFGMQESGLLLGNFVWVGQWRQCNRRHIFQPLPTNDDQLQASASQPVSFTGRYCSAKLVSPDWLPLIESKVKRLRKEEFFSSREHEDQYRRYFRIQLGFCLPESCDAGILKRRPGIIERLAKHRLGEPFFSSYRVADLFCMPDESSPLRQLELSGWLFLGCAGLWVLAILAATWFHWWRLMDAAGHKPKGLVACLSLIESWRTLTRSMRRKQQLQNRKQVTRLADTTTDCNNNSSNNGHNHSQKLVMVEENDEPPFPKPEPADLAFMNAIKVIVVPFIVFGHVGMLTLQSTSVPLDFDAVSSIIFHLLAGSTFYVDYYFCITGFLTCYSIFCAKVAPHKTSAGMWLYSIFRRYWRLAPTYLLLFWFSRSIFQLTGQGPLWDYGTSNMSVRSVCQRESWLTPITLTSNWNPLYEECNMPTWYISMDMQFYLITPFLLYLLSKSPFQGWLLLCSTIFGCLLIRAHRFYVDPKVDYLGLLRPRYDIIVRNQRDISDTYLLPHYRLPAYLFGILAGHYTYMVRAGLWRSPLTSSPSSKGFKGENHYRKWMCILGFVMCVTMQFGTGIMDSLFPEALEPYARQATALIFSTDHLLGALGPAMLLVSLSLGQWPPLRQHMEGPFWLYLSRISYFIYLFQMEMILWSVGIFVDEARSSNFEMLQLFVFLMVPLLVFALLATLLVSNPLNRLEHYLIGRRLISSKPRGETGSPRQLQQPPEAAAVSSSSSAAGLTQIASV